MTTVFRLPIRYLVFLVSTLSSCEHSLCVVVVVVSIIEFLISRVPGVSLHYSNIRGV